MSYFAAEDPGLERSLGCGPECKCGTCTAGVSGLNEWYEKEENDEPETTTQGIPPRYQTGAPANQLNDYNWFRSSFGYYGDDDAPAGAEPEPPVETNQQPSQPTSPTQPEQRQVAAEQRPTATESRPVIDEQRILRDAIGHGIRNPRRVTDIIFFARHPDLKASTTWANDAALLDEWRRIRDDIVIPELRRSIVLHRPVRRWRTRHPRLQGFPGFGLGYFAAPQLCDAARRDLAAVASDLTFINNELARGPRACSARLSLKRQLLDSDVDGMIRELDSYIASRCCEPALKTLETEIQALPWPSIVGPTKLRLLNEIIAAQARAKKDSQHC